MLFSKLVRSIYLSLTLFIIFGASAVSAAYDYRITNFTSEIEVKESTQIQVTETINVVFSYPKHGIYRNIPVIYRSAENNIHSRLKIISVTDPTGKKYDFKTTKQGDSIQLKIGDPDKTLTGEMTYVIKFTADNVIRRFPDHDELYWNTVGTGWDTVIEKASATIKSPYASVISSTCYTGLSGSTDTDCRVFKAGNDWQVISTSPIEMGSDLTFVLGFDPQNQFQFPSPTAVYWRDTGIWILISVLPGILFAVIWFFRGRDFRFLGDNVYFQSADTKQGTVALFTREHLPLVYSPIAGLTPAEAGTLLDLKVDLADLVAEISELARLGYIKIYKEIEDRVILWDKNDYLFVKTAKTPDIKLKDHQKFLLDRLFMHSYKAPLSILEKHLSKTEILTAESALLSKMKGKFSADLETFRTKLYTSMTKEGIFVSRPDIAKWVGFFLAVFISALVTIYASTQSLTVIFHYGLISGVVAALFGLQLGRRTAKGHALYRQLVGLKYFVGKGKWRYEIHEKHLFLEEILPLAISLGVIGKLTADMKDLQLEPPKYMNGFVVTDFNSFGRSVGSTLASTPAGKSSGWSGGSGFSGGSSGGGFGGGGGGSW